MTKKALLVAGALLAAIAGSGYAQTKPAPYDPRTATRIGGSVTDDIQPTTAAVCTRSPCVHKLTVDDSHEPCRIVVDPDIMVAKATHNLKIVWKVATPGYAFADDHALTFKDEEKEYLANKTFASRLAVRSSNQFSGRKKVSATEYEIVDKNSKDGVWLYSIVVVKDGRKCSIDPPIINEM